MASDKPVELSIVVPLYNEEPNVEPLVHEVRDALQQEYSWELILVDDGSSDGTRTRIREEARSEPRVRLLPLARNYGQSIAMRAGFDEARGSIVVSMDGDLQNDPADIPTLVQTLREGFDMVVGWRKTRWKGQFLSRKLPSLVANSLIRRLTGVPINDNGCSLRAYRREIVQNLPLYAELHRYLGAMIQVLSGARIAQVPVSHRSRQRGTSKYGLSRVWRVLIDLLTLTAIRRYRDNPALISSIPGMLWTVVGVALAGFVALSQTAGSWEFPIPVLTATSVLCIGVGIFLILLGLVSDTFLRHERETVGHQAHGERRA